MADNTILGLARLNQQLQKLAAIKGTKAIVAAGYALQRYSQQNAPVDTGNLRASPTVEETGDGQAELIYPVNYAVYQEFGTEDFEGRHYVQKAIDEHETDVIKAAQTEIQKEIKNAL